MTDESRYGPDSSSGEEKGPLPAYLQSALNILNLILDSPRLEKCHWLDLCCGKGKILEYFNFGENYLRCDKIIYYPYEYHQEYLEMAMTKATKFSAITPFINNASDLPVILKEYQFNFITFNLGLHEIQSEFLPSIITHCIKLLSSQGIMYVYDVEKTTERGAVSLNFRQAKELIDAMLNGLGEANYGPFISRWEHDHNKNIYGWSFVIRKEHLSVEMSLDNIERAIQCGKDCIRKQLSLEKEEIIVGTQEYLNNLEEADLDPKSSIYIQQALRSLSIDLTLKRIESERKRQNV